MAKKVAEKIDTKADWTYNDHKVSDRVEYLFGKRVKVITTYSLITGMTGEEFYCTVKELFPLGKEYFFRFDCDGEERLIRTPSIVEIREVRE